MASGLQKKFSDHCRICLKPKKDLIAWSEILLDAISYADAIELCTGISVLDEQDWFPRSICKDCEVCVVIAYDLRLQTEKARDVLVQHCSSEEEQEHEQEYSDTQQTELAYYESELSEPDEHFDVIDYKVEFLSKDHRPYVSDDDDREAYPISNSMRLVDDIENGDDGASENPNDGSSSDESSHEVATKQLCPVCAIAVNIDEYDAHYESHFDKEYHQFECTECDKQFESAHNLRVHMRKHTNEQPPFECKYCGEKFTHWANRKNHIHRKHSVGQKSYCCPICQQEFFDSNNYHIHVRRHTGEQKYKCSECDKILVSISALKLHMAAHTKERDHGCDLCDKKFDTRRALLCHRLTHSGERSYVCTVCSKPFARHQILRAHMSTHLQEYPDLVIPPLSTAASQADWRRTGPTNKHVKHSA